MTFFTTISAHLTWFVSPYQLPQHQQIPLLFQGINTHNIPAISAVLIALVTSVIIDLLVKKHFPETMLTKKLSSYQKINTPFLRIILGISFLFAFSNNLLFSPDFSHFSSLPIALWVQLMAGIMLVVGLLPQLAAALTALMYVNTFTFAPFGVAINHIHFLGASLYLILESHTDRFTIQSNAVRTYFKTITAQISQYSQAIFRISSGLSLITVAIQEKLLNPFYGLIFLEKYPLNFMQNLGFNFSNEHFVFCAALTEIAIGLLLIFNILPRLVAFIMLILFTITFIIFGVTELSGHALYMALIVMLLTSPERNFSKQPH